MPVLIDCLLEHEGPHSEVLLPVIINPLKTANVKLVKLKDMIETTLDLQLAEQGEYMVKANFDDRLQGITIDTNNNFMLSWNNQCYIPFLELKQEIDECQSKAEHALSRAGSDLKMDAKSVKLESNGTIGYYFRVTLKAEQNLRNNRSYHTIDTKKDGVRFRNSTLEDLNETYLRVRREYEQQQETVVKEILSVAGILAKATLFD